MPDAARRREHRVRRSPSLRRGAIHALSDHRRPGPRAQRRRAAGGRGRPLAPDRRPADRAVEPTCTTRSRTPSAPAASTRTCARTRCASSNGAPGTAARISWSAAGRHRRASSTTLPSTWTRASSSSGRPGAGASGASCRARRRSDCCTAAPCPVAVTPAELAAGWTPRHVGVGFVDVEDAHGAVRAAAAIARAAHADLRRQHGGRADHPQPVGRDRAVSRRRADRLRRSGARAARSTRCSPSCRPTWRRPARSWSARPPTRSPRSRGRVDLLVCGSRAYGPARHVLLGSVTHAVIRDASCPVVVVPRGTHNALVRALAPAAQATSR